MSEAYCIKKKGADVWSSLLKHLHERYGELVFRNWINRLTLGDVIGNKMVIFAPTRFIWELVIANYLKEMSDFIRNLRCEVRHIDIRVSSPNMSKFLSPSHPQKDNSAVHEAQITNIHDENSYISSKYTFENFVCGNTNAVSYTASKQIAENLANSAPNILKKLYIHAPVGMGKTHLLQAIANHVKTSNAKIKAVYLSSEIFTQKYVAAVRNNSLQEFKEYLSAIDLFLLDDLQLACGRAGTEKELVNTIENLTGAGKNIIIACDRSAHLVDFNERTKSRLLSFMEVSIDKPDYDLRLRILQSKTQGGFDPAMLEMIAQSESSSIRELEGIVNKVTTYCNLMNLEITESIIKRVLAEHGKLGDCITRDLLAPTNSPLFGQHIKTSFEKSNIRHFGRYNNNKRKSAIGCKSIKADGAYDNVALFNKIAESIAQRFGISISDIVSKNRASKLRLPRQLLAYLLRKLGKYGYRNIGKFLGNRDHSTIIYILHTAEDVINLPEVMKHLSVIEDVISKKMAMFE